MSTQAIESIIRDYAHGPDQSGRYIGGGSGRLELGRKLELAEKAHAELEAMRDELANAGNHRAYAVKVELLERDVATLRAAVARVGAVLADAGCDCDCAERCCGEHDDDCDRCLACRVEDALGGVR